MREDDYEEFTYPLSVFDEKPSRKKWIVASAIVVALLMLAGVFLAITAQGRSWISGKTAIITRAFSQALGFATPGGATQEIAMDATGKNFDEDSGAHMPTSSWSDGDADDITSDSSLFSAQLPSGAVKKTISKKSSSKSGTASASGADSQDGVLASPMNSDQAVSLASASSSVASSNVPSLSNNSAVNNQTVILPGTTYPITVMVTGNGRGFVSSTEAGITCDGTGTCSWNFLAGQKVTLHASHDGESSFAGWSGGCSGTSATCTLTPHAAVAVMATFRLTATAMSVPTNSIVSNQSINISKDISTPTPSSSENIASSSDTTNSGDTTTTDLSNTNTDTSTDTSPSSENVGSGSVLVAAVQIAGAESSNDFVKLYNPTGTAVDMSGWKLHKKSSTGADYSLKAFANGTTIAAGGYFMWANSADGFSDTMGADVASTETLSADNSVALLDASGNVIDAVAWGTGVGQYGEGPPFLNDPTAGQVLTRQTLNGAMVNTENNANDFNVSS